MQILVKTDSHIDGTAELTQQAQSIVQQALGRYSERITRIDVYLSDENSGQKSGDADKRCVIEARLGGLQPITVRHHGSTTYQALGGAADKLEKTLKRTVGRKGSLYKRRARERAEWAAAGPRLEQDAQTGRQEHFREVLRPLLGHLAQHARRELRIMEANGTLFPGQVAYSELLDELLTRAWLQLSNRPQGMALDLWLTKLLDQLLQEHARQVQRGQAIHRPAEAEASQSPPQVGEQEWWAWLLGEGDTSEEEAAIPSRHSAWAEEYLEAEELMHRIHEILGDLPNVQRQAFVLNVLEAYDLAEIAMLQDRPETEIRSDVEAARNYLRDRLGEGGHQQTSTDPATETIVPSAEGN